MKEVASPWRRLAGSLIDSAVLFVVAIPFFLSAFSEPSSRIWPAIVVGILTACYSVIPHAIYGRTPGKLIAGTIVLDSSQRPIGFTQAMVRYLPFLLPTLALLISVSSGRELPVLQDGLSLTETTSWLVQVFGFFDVLILLFNEERRAIHDLMAGTMVFRNK